MTLKSTEKYVCDEGQQHIPFYCTTKKSFLGGCKILEKEEFSKTYQKMQTHMLAAT